MRAIVFTGAGGPEVMSLEERPDPVPGSDEVLVAASYSGINPADLNQRAGHYPAPPGAPADIPGLEVSGTVVAVGRNVSEWSEGDRVFGVVGGGGHADRAVVHARHVARIPDRLGDDQAAAVPEAFITAHDACYTQADLRAGERLLVNGANGGVGLAAVQMGLATGVHVLANARSQRARERLGPLRGAAGAPGGGEKARAAGRTRRGAGVAGRGEERGRDPGAGWSAQPGRKLRGGGAARPDRDRQHGRRLDSRDAAAGADGKARDHDRHAAAGAADRAEGRRRAGLRPPGGAAARVGRDRPRRRPGVPG